MPKIRKFSYTDRALQANPKLRGREEFTFECPGCGTHHHIRSKGDEPVWGFNGDVERPTFTPSLLVQWRDKNGPQKCHSFITDGKIRFLGDCTHEHAGKTLDMRDMD